jgi:hypothetical protein
MRKRRRDRLGEMVVLSAVIAGRLAGQPLAAPNLDGPYFLIINLVVEALTAIGATMDAVTRFPGIIVPASIVLVLASSMWAVRRRVKRTRELRSRIGAADGRSGRRPVDRLADLGFDATADVRAPALVAGVMTNRAMGGLSYRVADDDCLGGFKVQSQDGSADGTFQLSGGSSGCGHRNEF